MPTYHHFSPPEREEISRGLAQGLSIRAISASLHRSPSSVCREIRRNAGLSGYRAYSAGRRAWRRTLIPRQQPFTVLRPALWQLVQDKLRL